MQIARLHANLMFTILAVVALCSMVCFVQALRNHHLTPLQRAGFWIAELLIITEAALGGILWFQAVRPLQPTTHLIYALVALMIIPIGMGTLITGSARRTQLSLGMLGIFLLAIILRSLQTGRFS
jgi:hypothetical protein